MGIGSAAISQTAELRAMWQMLALYLGWLSDILPGHAIEHFIKHATEHSIEHPPSTLHPTPYTLHPTPYTLHPTTHTLDPRPQA